MPRVDPLLVSLTDSEYDIVGCLAAGFTIADALRILGRDPNQEAALRADPRFHAVVRASAEHLAAVSGSLSKQNPACALPMNGPPAVSARKKPVVALETKAVPTMSLQELLRLPVVSPRSRA